MRDRKKVDTQNSRKESELLKQGRWLDFDERKSLYCYCLSTLKRFVASNGVVKKKKVLRLNSNPKTAKLFQNALITLFHFGIGGQRSEVITGLTIRVFFLFYLTSQNITCDEITGEYTLKLSTEKVMRSLNSEGLYIPKYLGKLVDFFKEKVRPALKPKEGIVGLWINGHGKPAGNSISTSLFRTTLHLQLCHFICCFSFPWKAHHSFGFSQNDPNFFVE